MRNARTVVHTTSVTIGKVLQHLIGLVVGGQGRKVFRPKLWDVRFLLSKAIDLPLEDKFSLVKAHTVV